MEKNHKAGSRQPFSFIVAGVESTGKSMLTEALAHRFQKPWVAEFAREYLEVHSYTYDYEDFIRIAKGQEAAENQAMKEYRQEDFLFFDTDFLVIQVWSEVVFGKVEAWITERIRSYGPKFYFITNTEVPWVADGMREYPDPLVREALHQRYLDVIRYYGFPFKEITGCDYKQRLEQAAKEVTKLIRVQYPVS